MRTLTTLPAQQRRRSPSLLAIIDRLPLFLLALTFLTTLTSSREIVNRDVHTLSTTSIKELVELDPAEWVSVDEGHLGKLLIPRASGTENNTLVQKYISSVFKRLNWHEERVTFTDQTPIGPIEFTNLIYTYPSSPFSSRPTRNILLSAHFDSKYFPEAPMNGFIGATDSAAPCAMMLDLAEALTPLLEEKARRQVIEDEDGDGGFWDEVDRGVGFVFFDGEEAIEDWTATDSIYGARYLAELWESTYLPRSHPLSKRRMSPPPTILSTIDHLVLLDLLGNSNSRIYSYYRETDWLFDLMASADLRLREEGLVDVEKGEEGWFGPYRLPPGGIGDDHVPFVARGVSVMHVISNPFPRVWHSLADDASALSMPAMKRWNRILRVFTAEYLGLEPVGKHVSRAVDELVGLQAFCPTGEGKLIRGTVDA